MSFQLREVFKGPDTNTRGRKITNDTYIEDPRWTCFKCKIVGISIKGRCPTCRRKKNGIF